MFSAATTDESHSVGISCLIRPRFFYPNLPAIALCFDERSEVDTDSSINSCMLLKSEVLKLSTS
jgi:hypothetical protein